MKIISTLSILAIVLFVTGCGGASSKLTGTWQQEGDKAVTLEITKSTMRSGNAAMQFTANYSVVKVDGNKTTVKLSVDGKDEGEIVLDFDPANGVLFINDSAVFGGRWKRK